MQLHTRVILKLREPHHTMFWDSVEDFGIPYTPDRDDACRHPKVLERIEAGKKRFGDNVVIHVDFRDAG